MYVEEATYEYTRCRTSHMTLFGAGFFVQPNTINFDYVFKQADLSDNVTIYSTVAICLAAFLVFLLWAGWQDHRDLVVRLFQSNVKGRKSRSRMISSFWLVGWYGEL